MFQNAEFRDLLTREKAKVFKFSLPYYAPDAQGICKRDVLVQWIVAQSMQFNHSKKTLELAVIYIDTYLHCFNIQNSFFQLLGITAYSIASKFNETEVGQQIKLFDSEGQAMYSEQEYNEMEVQLLYALGYQLNYVTPSDYLCDIMNEQVQSLLMFVMLDMEIYKHPHIVLALAIFDFTNNSKHIFTEKILAVSQLIQNKIIKAQESEDLEDTKSIEKSLPVSKKISKKRNSKKTQQAAQQQ